MQVSGSKDLEGVHGAIKVLDLECASTGRWIGQVSAGQLGAATEDEGCFSTAYGYRKGGQM